MKVLTIGVQPDTLSLLASRFTLERADTLEYAEDINEYLRQDQYDVLLVDLDNSLLGSSFVSSLRKYGVIVPILAIGGLEDSNWHDHRAKFLELGGDDLLRSPGSPREIAASITACMRRVSSVSLGKITDLIQLDESAIIRLDVDTRKHTVMVEGYPVDLTRHELSLLSTLVERRDRVVTKEALLVAMYNGRDEPEVKIVDVFVCKIRRKFDQIYPGLGRVVKTVWGMGYQYDPQRALAQETKRI